MKRPEFPKPPKPTLTPPTKPTPTTSARPVITKPSKPIASKPVRPSEAVPKVLPESSPLDVAQWMLSQVYASGFLYQGTAAHEIRTRFGQRFLRTNENGNTGLVGTVLKEFRRLDEHGVVWMRGEQTWRTRQSHHGPGREQP